MRVYSLFSLVGLTMSLPVNGPDQHVSPVGHNTLAEPRKRGLAYNDANLIKLFDDPNSRVYWMYNWESNPRTSNAWQEYVPMLHDLRSEKTATWSKDVDAAAKKGAGDTHVFSFNEPDQCGNGGACMQNVGSTIAAHKQWMEPLHKYGDRMKIGAPAVTNGIRDSKTGSIMGLEWLNEFINGCQGCRLDFVAIHWYGASKDADDFKNFVKSAHEKSGNRAVWVTEFAAAGSSADITGFMKSVLPWLDQQSFAYRYSWYWTAKGSLVNSDGTALSDIGKVYNTYGG